MLYWNLCWSNWLRLWNGRIRPYCNIILYLRLWNDRSRSSCIGLSGLFILRTRISLSRHIIHYSCRLNLYTSINSFYCSVYLSITLALTTSYTITTSCILIYKKIKQIIPLNLIRSINPKSYRHNSRITTPTGHLHHQKNIFIKKLHNFLLTYRVNPIKFNYRYLIYKILLALGFALRDELYASVALFWVWVGE